MIKSPNQLSINCKSLFVYIFQPPQWMLIPAYRWRILSNTIVLAQSPSDDRKLELLKNSWTPPWSYNFPKTHFYGKIRAFCFEWLTQFCGWSTLRLGMERFAAFVFYLDTWQERTVTALTNYIRVLKRTGYPQARSSRNTSLVPNFTRQRLVAQRISFGHRKGKCRLSHSSSVIFIVTLSNLTDRSYDLS